MGVIQSLIIRPKRKEVPVAKSEINILKTGIEGDHHFKPVSKRTVTLISSDALDEVAAAVGFKGDAHLACRRNICLENLPKENMIGRKIAIGNDVLLEVTCYCDPCYRMDENLGEGALNAFHEKAGWGAIVVREGQVKTGDHFEVL
jgi:MOSC domain-containing protein YiiM